MPPSIASFNLHCPVFAYKFDNPFSVFPFSPLGMVPTFGYIWSGWYGAVVRFAGLGAVRMVQLVQKAVPGVPRIVGASDAVRTLGTYQPYCTRPTVQRFQDDGKHRFRTAGMR